MKSDRLNIRIDADLKDELKKLADKQNRTVSNYIEYLIKQELKTNDKQ